MVIRPEDIHNECRTDLIEKEIDTIIKNNYNPFTERAIVYIKDIRTNDTKQNIYIQTLTKNHCELLKDFIKTYEEYWTVEYTPERYSCKNEKMNDEYLEFRRKNESN